MRIFALLAAMLPTVAAAAECTARSGPNVTPVIELYTSEGCSSCPPADRWLSSLAAEAASGRLVALAFHVDYWDYIGWKDPFASARGTQRQRDLQALAGSRYVYTPQVVLAGRDFRAWHASGSAAALEAIRRRPASTSIEVSVKADPVAGIAATSVASGPDTRARDLVVLLAVTQNGLSSRVTKGENRGERLGHDFVVRDFTLHQGLGRASATFRPAAGWNLARMGVAAMVQDRKTGEVLQAVSCALPA